MELNEDRVFYIPEVVNSGDVIKIYYVTDPDQKTEVTYKVEYYKDNVLQGSDTQTERKLVQVLEEKVLEVNKDNINITDKYPGYTFDKTDPEELPEIVADGSTIKVYYVKTKYPYSVEYYYNNEIDEDLTEHGEAYKDDTIEEYTNKPKEGYEFDSVDKVPLVISDTEPNVIKVYYLPIRKITVNHIDKNDETNILETEEKEGKEGSTITTEAKDFEEYILVEKPETEEYTFTEEEQVVNYYYAKVSSGVIEKHIDTISGKPVADSTLYDGYEGKEYETSPLEEIEGYEIATNKEYYEMIVLKENPNFLEENEVQTLEEYFELKEINAEDPYIPENAKGEMTDELIEVKYYYTPKVKLIVKYVDILTDLEIPEKVDEELIDSTVTKEGKIGDHYQTEAKEFDGYVLESVPENAEGEYKITLNDDGTYTKEIVVTYYYIVEREVIVRYYDKISGEEISTETVKIGPDGEAYDLSTEQKEIEGYTLVEVPENPTGVYQEENETRKFYYAKNTQVVVKYVDEDTGEVINDSDNYTINGYIGKEYESEKKEFSGYEYTKDTENTKGEMEKDTIEVIYYYKKLPKETVVNQPTTTETSVTTNNNNTNTSTITPTIKTETTTKSSTKTTKASTNTTKATNTKNNTEKKETKIVPPNTGDKTPIVAIEVIVIVVIANIIQIALMKKKINKGHHVR